MSLEDYILEEDVNTPGKRKNTFLFLNNECFSGYA